MKKTMNTSIKRLIGINALNAVAEIYLGTFLTARIYDMAENATQTIAIYYIIQYVFIAGTFILLGNFFKRSPLVAFRGGMILNLILLLAIMRADNIIVNYYPILACVFGIALGLFYGPLQVLLGNLISDDSVRYCTVSTILYNVVNVVFPITIGAYIESTSFAAVTLCIIIVTSLEIIISFGIEKISTSERCDLFKFLRVLKEKKIYKVWNCYVIVFLKGITSSVLDRTVLILIMMMFGSTMQLGILTTVFSAFTIISSWVIKKHYKPNTAKGIIIVSAIMPMVAVIALIICTNSATFILYKAISAIFICILSLLADVNRYNCIEDKQMIKEYAAEHQTLSEIVLAIGRICGLSILLIVNGIIGGMIAIKVMLFIIGLAIIVYAAFINRSSKL